MIKRTPKTLFTLDISNKPQMEVHVIGRRKLILIQKSSIVMIQVFRQFEEEMIIQLDLEFDDLDQVMSIGNVIAFTDLNWQEKKSENRG